MARRALYFLISLLLLISCSGNNKADSVQNDTDTIPMIILQVQKCSKLYTAEYKIHKIITHDDIIRVKGTFLQQTFNFKVPLGDRKIAIPMDATLKAYIDFNDFSADNIVKRNGKITIILPDPKVTMTSSKIDQRNIKEYVALTRAHFSDSEMADYEQQGRASIIQSIPQLGIIEMARESAARTIIPMLKGLCFDERDVTITFKKEFTEKDLPAIFDKSNFNR